MQFFSRGRRAAGPSRTSRRRARTAIPMGVAAAMLLGGVAWADNLVVDGDGLAPVSGNALNLETVCVGQEKSGNALLAIQRTGSGQVYANSASVTVSAGQPDGTHSAAVSTAFLDNGIALPGNWVGAGNNTMSSDTATSKVTVTGATPTGPQSATVLYTASGGANGGGTLNRTATLTINWTVVACDTTPPVITANVAGTVGNNGWYTSDVSVSWTVTDNESTISSTTGCGPTTINADTAGQTLTCSATSLGGTNSQSVTIERDATPPTIGGSAAPTPNGNGWNNTHVDVSFICADNLSGLASCGPDQTVSSEGAGQSATGTAVDQAGNSASATISGINIDTTAPTVSASAAPAPNGSGWNNSAVTVSFSGTDAGSGIADCDAPVVLSGDGADQSATGSCTDLAGNSASATASGINIDTTAPTVLVNGVTNGATYLLGSVPAASCSTSDALSGVATAASLSSSGGPLGPVTAICGGALDAAGNPGSASATYNVKYNFTGFFRPVDMGAVLNQVKAGSAIPVKFNLGGNQGLNIFTAGFPKSSTMACDNSAAVDQVEETVTANNSGLTYDVVADQYNYVWKTEKTWNGCRKLTVRLIDGQEYTAMFKFTK